MYPDLLTGDFFVDPSPSAVPEGSGVTYPPLSPQASPSYPPYVQANADGSYVCLWCESKLLASADQLSAHLYGKEHTKRCANSSISPYGSVGHEAEVAAYVTLYGHDPYARLRHWPACIEETELYWSCSACGGKKFQTQRAVNDHLLEASHADRLSRVTSQQAMNTSSPVSNTARDWPECIKDEGQFWTCTVCVKKFNSEALVNDHLVHPRHVQRVTSQTESSSERKTNRSGNKLWSAVKEEAERKLRLERLARFIDFDRLECRLCELKFSSLRETENHIDDLVHIAHNYEFTIDNLA